MKNYTGMTGNKRLRKQSSRFVKGRGGDVDFQRPSWQIDIEGTDLKWDCPHFHNGNVKIGDDVLNFFYNTKTFYFKGVKYRGTREQCEDFIRSVVDGRSNKD